MDGVVATAASQRMVALLDVVRQSGGLGVITAPTGTGKTHTVKAWAEGNQALYLSLAGGATLKRDAILRSLFSKLGDLSRVPDHVRFNPGDAYGLVLAGLRPKQPAGRKMGRPYHHQMRHDEPAVHTPAPMSLILDEAQRLDFDGLTVLSDFATDGVPVVAVGGTRLREELFGKDRVDQQGQELAAVRSRFRHRLLLDGKPTDDEAAAIFAARGVTEPAALAALCFIAHAVDGGLREAASVLEEAQRRSGSAAVREAIVRTVALDMGVLVR
jgi:DNA transposition AAA+ family ATPase